MARWIYQRPIDCCDPTELIVAKRLALLPDEWVIRWGFYYDTDREGDFLILGPTGGVLVLELKGGQLRKLSTTGRWEGPDRDHPLNQLSAEWKAVLAQIQDTAAGKVVPFVAKALCLADLTVDPKIPAYKEIDRNLIVDRGDLTAFETTWGRLFSRHDHPVSDEERKVFLVSCAKDISPKVIRHFISETDRVLLRQTTAEYHVLDMLRNKTLQSPATLGLVNNLRQRTALPEGPDVELYNLKVERTATKLEEVVTQWVSDGFCRADEILILSPHGTKVKTSVAGYFKIGEWPFVSCVVTKPGEPLLSINKAKGLDLLAVIMIDVQSIDKLSTAQEQMDYFMGASRARQLLAIIRRESQQEYRMYPVAVQSWAFRSVIFDLSRVSLLSRFDERPERRYARANMSAPEQFSKISSGAGDDETEESLGALRSLIVDCREFRDLERKLGRFNLFEVLRLQDHEIRHSNVLAWLLDPRRNHGLKDMFLRRWLMRVFHESESPAATCFDPIDLDVTPFQEVTVFREWTGVDLLVEIVTANNDRWVICVENKIWSLQQSDQLNRYARRVKAAFPSATCAFIFLTVQAESPDDERFVSASYEDVSITLESCLIELAGAIGLEPRLVIEHYLQIIQTRFMENSEVEKMARRIYAAHQQALDIIFEYRPDNVLTLTEAVVKGVDQENRLPTVKYLGHRKGKVYVLPHAWDVIGNKSDTGVYVWLELRLRDKLFLKAKAGPTDKAWREKLFVLSQQKGFKNTQTKKQLPAEYFTFYAVRGSDIKWERVEAEAIADYTIEILKWYAGEMANSDFGAMLEVVANHLKTHPSASQSTNSGNAAGSSDPIT